MGQKQNNIIDTEKLEKQKKIDKVAKIAYKKGYEKRMSTRELIRSDYAAEIEYMQRYGCVPSEEASQERWNIFLENYQKGFSDAANKITKEMHSEDF